MGRPRDGARGASVHLRHPDLVDGPAAEGDRPPQGDERVRIGVAVGDDLEARGQRPRGHRRGPPGEVFEIHGSPDQGARPDEGRAEPRPRARGRPLTARPTRCRTSGGTWAVTRSTSPPRSRARLEGQEPVDETVGRPPAGERLVRDLGDPPGAARDSPGRRADRALPRRGGSSRRSLEHPRSSGPPRAAMSQATTALRALKPICRAQERRPLGVRLHGATLWLNAMPRAVPSVVGSKPRRAPMAAVAPKPPAVPGRKKRSGAREATPMWQATSTPRVTAAAGRARRPRPGARPGLARPPAPPSTGAPPPARAPGRTPSYGSGRRSPGRRWARADARPAQHPALVAGAPPRGTATSSSPQGPALPATPTPIASSRRSWLADTDSGGGSEYPGARVLGQGRDGVHLRRRPVPSRR